MSSRFVIARHPLPPTHYFVTVARGTQARTYALRSLAVHVGGILLGLAGVWCLFATLYLVFHDDLTAALVKQESQMQFAYESRLAELRNELERATSRQFLSQRVLGDQLHVLLSRAAELEDRTAKITSLAEHNGSVARASGSMSPGEARKNGPAGEGPQAGVGLEIRGPGDHELSPPPDQAKPAFENDSRGDRASQRSSNTGLDLGAAGAKLAAVAESLDRTEATQLGALRGIAQKAQERIAKIEIALDDIGLSTSGLASASPTTKGAAVGGPLVPLHFEQSGSAFDRAAFELQESMDAMDRLRRLLVHVPYRAPSSEPLVVTSGFGPRTDPFTGHPALHTGIDVAMDYGAPVQATAAGRVTIAGLDHGYGNLVEIDHGNGLSTRYAHLSTIIVEPGQWVEAGAIIGNVGATGRATGPHLHYETRVDGQPIDPARFLRAGDELVSAQR